MKRDLTTGAAVLAVLPRVNLITKGFGILSVVPAELAVSEGCEKAVQAFLLHTPFDITRIEAPKEKVMVLLTMKSFRIYA